MPTPSVTQTASRARQTALSAIERQERYTKMAVAAAGAIEAILIAAILLAIDFSNPTHKLILLATLLTYLPLALGMMALASLNSRHTRSILLALQMVSEERGQQG